jgi:D-alanine-D-alanine ligase
MPAISVAIAMGGFSPEAEVSLKSGEVVYRHLPRNIYRPTKVLIDHSGWFAWVDDLKIPINRHDFSYEYRGETVRFDVVFMAIHGSPGEDGVLQGYLDLLGIPYTTSGVFASSLGFSKAECNMVVARMGVPVAKSMFLTEVQPNEEQSILAELSLPLFVKPNRSGSSFGVSKVDKAEALGAALREARKHDTLVVAEEMIPGTEIACGVVDFGGTIQPLAVTEIVPKNAFFDYEAKYQGASEEITPGRFPQSVIDTALGYALRVYKGLGLKGIARIDFIVRPDGVPVMLEVNTVPGLSEASIVPQQAAYKGYTLETFFDLALQTALKAHRP